MTKVVLLFGPTGVSKTELSLELGQGIAEIISADSMQIYRQMDIGTAKISLEKRQIVPHHLIDIVDPDQYFSVADFRQLCTESISDIRSRGKMPFVVGGTGLYIKVLIDGLFEGATRDDAVRNRLMEEAAENGNDYLYNRLEGIDPERADSIAVQDLKRIVRALEVYETTQVTMTELLKTQRKEKSYDFLKIGLTRDRQELYQKIDQRCDDMLRLGLIDEVKALKAQGYNLDHQSMKAIGYRHALQYLNGDYDLEEMIRLFKRDSRRFAKRQWTLFNRIDDCHWFHPSEKEKIQELLFKFIE